MTTQIKHFVTETTVDNITINNIFSFVSLYETHFNQTNNSTLLEFIDSNGKHKTIEIEHTGAKNPGAILHNNIIHTISELLYLNNSVLFENYITQHSNNM